MGLFDAFSAFSPGSDYWSSLLHSDMANVQPETATTATAAPSRGLFSRFTTPDPTTGASALDQIGMLGAQLRDMGSGRGGNQNEQAMAEMLSARQKQAMAMQQAKQKQAALSAFAQRFGGGQLPQAGGQPAPGQPPSQAAAPGVAQPQAQGFPGVRALAPDLARLAAAGVDISDYITLADKASPDIAIGPDGRAYDKRDPSVLSQRFGNPANVNGTILNLNDPENLNRTVPTLDKGQEFLYDQSGRPVAVRNMDGSVQAAAQMAGATAQAQEGAKAQLDLVPVPLGDGRTQMMPRAEAAQILSRGGIGGGFGVSQSPADQAAAVDLAKGGAERQLAEPQAFSGLQDQARATDLVLGQIDKVLPMISGMSAGLGANLAPIKGTAAHDLQAALDVIRSNIGFAELQKMRQNSPTGGALGAVSERENSLLQSVLGSLDAGQSPEQLAQSLAQIRQQLATIKGQREGLYNDTYGKRAPPVSKAVPSRADVAAEMRRRGLLK